MTGRFKKDNNIFGSILGICTIIISFLIIYITTQVFGFDDTLLRKKLFLLCIIPNIFLIRYYFKVLYFEKTGKSILFISFLFLVAFMIYFFKR
jgi:hypothetical protein